MYRGQQAFIQLGMGGIISDMPQSRMPVERLIEAKNVTLVNGYCEKHPGVRPWNRDNPITGSTAISGGVRTFIEYWPDSLNQRVLVLSKTGSVYKFTNPYTRTQVTANLSKSAPATLNVSSQAHIASGGQEVPGAIKKAFIFSGNDQVQVIEGDGTTYRPITKPAFDWASSYPKYGLNFRGRLWCFGNQNVPDFLYASAEGDQEDFQTTSTPAQASDFQFFDVSPGEGNGISGLFVFKNRLFICKSPNGLYQLNDEDPDPAFWYITRVNADFGLSGSHGIAQLFDDVLIYNTQGTISSLSASFQFGDIESADIFNSLLNERYFRQITSGFGVPDSYGFFYQEKKQIYFTFRSTSGVSQDRIVVIDYLNKKPEVVISTKDVTTCLSGIADSSGIARPVYGSDDGNLYEMDIPNRWIQTPVSNSAYEFVAQTPHMDFSSSDPALGLRTKRWDFLELTFQPTGDWNVDVDVYIDSEFSETIQFNMNRDRPLGLFILDTDRLDGDFPKSLRKPLHGQGRTISFRLRSNGLSQNIKIQSLMVYFRVSDERQIKDPRS